MNRDPICCRCGKKGHRASECRSKLEIPPPCIYSNRVCHTAENCTVRRSKEAIQKQDVRFTKNSDPTDAKRAESSRQNNFVSVKEEDPM